MRKHRITDHDAEALVTGAAPADRPELSNLAQSITQIRVAAFAAPPRPSAELRARLELAPANEVSASADLKAVAETIDARQPAAARRPASTGGMKRMFAWLTGLGLTAKIVLGVSVAAAAGATGVGTAVGVNALVSSSAEQEQVAPDDDATDEPADPADAPTDAPDTFGDSVSDRAHELGKDGDGKAFGEEISQEAQQLGGEKAQNPGVPVPGAGNGQGTAPERPDVVPGGDD